MTFARPPRQRRAGGRDTRRDSRPRRKTVRRGTPALRSGRRALLKRRIVAKRWKLALGVDGRPARVDVASELQSAPSLTEAEVVELGAQALAIEAHYSARAGRPMPMDIEFAHDGDDGRLYVLQARPETVHRGEQRPAVEVFSLAEGGPRERLVSGVAVGQRIGAGPVCPGP